MERYRWLLQRERDIDGRLFHESRISKVFWIWFRNTHCLDQFSKSYNVIITVASFFSISSTFALRSLIMNEMNFEFGGLLRIYRGREFNDPTTLLFPFRKRIIMKVCFVCSSQSLLQTLTTEQIMVKNRSITQTTRVSIEFRISTHILFGQPKS